MIDWPPILTLVAAFMLYSWDILRLWFSHKEKMVTLQPPLKEASASPKVDSGKTDIKITVTNKDSSALYSIESFRDYVTFFPAYEGPITFSSESTRNKNKNSPFKRAFAIWFVEEDLLLNFLFKTLKWTPTKIASYLQRSEKGVLARLKRLKIW